MRMIGYKCRRPNGSGGYDDNLRMRRTCVGGRWCTRCRHIDNNALNNDSGGINDDNMNTILKFGGWCCNEIFLQSTQPVNKIADVAWNLQRRVFYTERRYDMRLWLATEQANENDRKKELSDDFFEWWRCLWIVINRNTDESSSIWRDESKGFRWKNSRCDGRDSNGASMKTAWRCNFIKLEPQRATWRHQ
jgi:hypothetical protein